MNMYVPGTFKVEDPPALHAMMRSVGLATVVTNGERGLEASHVPLILDPAQGKYGTLYGHLARANLQSEVPENTQALAIFMGPDAYITPTWYETKTQTGEVVPTWNYVAVHASGPLTFFSDPEELLGLVTRLTELHEQPRKEPWSVSDAPAAYIARQLKAIIGFRLEITTLQGKWKMSQNRSAEDQRGVLAGLQADGVEAVASIMQPLVKGR